jgi:hypothetical protein
MKFVAQDKVFADLYESEPGRRANIPTSVPVAQGVMHTRGALIGFFNSNPTTWVETEITLAQLKVSAALKNAWWPIAAETVEQAVRAVTDLQGVSMTPQQLKHRLTLVATAADARPVLLDGYHRAHGLIQAGDAAPIPVYFGVCPSLAAWHLYQ